MISEQSQLAITVELASDDEPILTYKKEGLHCRHISVYSLSTAYVCLYLLLCLRNGAAETSLSY